MNAEGTIGASTDRTRTGRLEYETVHCIKCNKIHTIVYEDLDSSPLQLGRKSKTSNSAKETPVTIDLDKSTSDKPVRVRDSMSGQTNIMTCSVCLEDLTASRNPTTTRCGHLYCLECLEQVFLKSKKCPKCQSDIKAKSCQRIYF